MASVRRRHFVVAALPAALAASVQPAAVSHQDRHHQHRLIRSTGRDIDNAWSSPSRGHAHSELTRASSLVWPNGTVALPAVLAELGPRKAVHASASRERQEVLNLKEAISTHVGGTACFKPCGSESGFCDLCNVGKFKGACCKKGDTNEPNECKGAEFHKSGVHECVIVRATSVGAPENTCYEARNLVADEGKTIGSITPYDIGLCKASCNRDINCRSFAACRRDEDGKGVGGCWLKDKRVSKADRTNEGVSPARGCQTFYQFRCDASCPIDCDAPTCVEGTVDGGQKLLKGTCMAYCSKKDPQGTRFCGTLDSYKQGDYVDCTGCGVPSIPKDPRPKKAGARGPAGTETTTTRLPTEAPQLNTSQVHAAAHDIIDNMHFVSEYRHPHLKYNDTDNGTANASSAGEEEKKGNAAMIGAAVGGVVLIGVGIVVIKKRKEAKRKKEEEAAAAAAWQQQEWYGEEEWGQEQWEGQAGGGGQKW
eukprot:TRINITY_DN73314_c0_g1_i1.p1 TRINITY_DN73314_c0_g1~~TRINITY_DN73314_c0_g1_i1.p1  ORF type:complete len:480 (+),score=90.96 TRINITY_DN73314_c0_g1_i1:119-1558(+)